MSSSPRSAPHGSSGGRTRTSRHQHAGVGRWLAATAAVVAVAAAALTMSTTSGTLALWNDSAEIPEATIEVGGVDLAITAGSASAPQGQTTAALGPQTWASMLPGDVIGVPITLTSRSAAPVRVSAALDSASAGQGDATFWLSQGTCPASGTAGVRITDRAAQVPGAPLSTDGVHCLQVALSSTIPAARQGTQIVPAFTLTLTAVPERTP